jgi:hypothetical protein
VKFFKEKKSQWLLLAVSLILLGTVLYFQRPRASNFVNAEKETPISDDNAKYPFKAFSGSVEITRDLAAVSVSGEGPTALDGMNFEQLTKFRLEHVEKYRQLGFFHPGYDPFSPPHNQIYRNITPGAPWLYSVPYYLANPYLLIVLVAANHVTPIDIYVPELSIKYDNGIISETIRGTSAQAWFAFVNSSRADYPGQIRPIMVNAWDAGFYYIFLDRQRSRNIKLNEIPEHLSQAPYSLSGFFHVGKYKKNNLSPESRNSWVELSEKNKPAYLYFKLWRKKPAEVSDRADLIFIFDIDPGRT